MSIIKSLSYVGRKGIDSCSTLGRAGYLLFNIVIAKPEPSRNIPILIKQLYRVGVQSFFIIVISGLFIGMVLSLQGYLTLTSYGAEASLGMLVALSLLRELGPVVSALLFAGRAGSALTAEIGLMKTTEQLSSLEMMAIDPTKRVIAPRFWAGVISLPLLTALFVSAGILGANMVAVDWKGIDAGFFWSAMLDAVTSSDLINCFFKSVSFSVITTWISVFNGYDSIPTSEGISQATTRTVVYSSLAVLSVDFLLTALMFGNE